MSVVVNVKARRPDGDPLMIPKLRLIAAGSSSRYVILVTCCASGLDVLRNPYTVETGACGGIECGVWRVGVEKWRWSVCGIV